ncbi:MAG: SurA N-terminal domain-containing protein [Balneolaceae bacterium]|nr:SurA N-terminal domain-containing protein [Balneolaceae bacterium]
MGVMEKMRNSTSSILWILIFSFGILWVLADVDFFGGMTQGPRNLGMVNGDAITLNEYNQRVSFYTEQFNQQSDTPMSPEIRALYENQAWEDLVAARLLQQKMDELGITVTDSELMEMVTGDNPDPFIRQQFADETGQIDRIALQTAIDSPENSEVWILIEQQLRENRRQQKFNNYISSGMRVTPMEVQNEYIRENSFADIEFVRYPYSVIQDSEISITDSELQQYYRENSDQYQRDETYRFRYVSWDKTPTSEDTLNTVREIEDLRSAFESASDDSMFVMRYQSSTPYRGTFVNVENIREEFSPVIDLEVGEVSEVVMVDGNPHVFKKIDQRGNEIKFAVLSYDVIADPIATIDRLAEEANEFTFYADSEGFEEEAERNGKEIREATATKDTPFIPGLGQSQVAVDALEELSVNEISEPIELNEQFIVAQMIERTPAGTRPFNEVRNQVEIALRNQKRQVQALARVTEQLTANSDLESLSEALEREISSAEDIRFSGTTIPGAGREVEVIGSIFGMEEGETSGAIQGSNAVFVIRVVNMDRADPAAMTAEEQNVLRNRLEQQKFMAFNQVFIERLKEEASIQDNRDRILR